MTSEEARSFARCCRIYAIFTQGSFAQVSTLDGPEGEGMVWRLSLGSSEEVSKGLGKFESIPRGPGGQPTSPRKRGGGAQIWARSSHFRRKRSFFVVGGIPGIGCPESRSDTDLFCRFACKEDNPGVQGLSWS